MGKVEKARVCLGRPLIQECTSSSFLSLFSPSSFACDYFLPLNRCRILNIPDGVNLDDPVIAPLYCMV